MDNSNSLNGLLGMMVEPSKVVTSIPGIIGYYPDGHIVLVTGGIGNNPHTGIDMPFLGPVAVCKSNVPGQLDQRIEDIAEFIRDYGCEFLAVYVVDRRWGTEDHAEIVTIAEDYAQELAKHGLGIESIFGVSEIFPGEPITNVGHELMGIVETPSNTMAAQRLYDAGETIVGSEEETNRRFEPLTDIPLSQQRILDEASAAAWIDVHVPQAIALDNSDGRLGGFYAEWLDTVKALHRGDLTLDALFQDEQHTRVVLRMLENVILRDMMIAHIDGELADTVRELWLVAIQLFRGEIRCNALTCYAIDRINVGATNVANRALWASEEEDPHHSLTGLLLIAIGSGIEDRCLETIKRAAQHVIRATRKSSS